MSQSVANLITRAILEAEGPVEIQKQSATHGLNRPDKKKEPQ